MKGMEIIQTPDGVIEKEVTDLAEKVIPKLTSSNFYYAVRGTLFEGYNTLAAPFRAGSSIDAYNHCLQTILSYPTQHGSSLSAVKKALEKMFENLERYSANLKIQSLLAKAVNYEFPWNVQLEFLDEGGEVKSKLALVLREIEDFQASNAKKQA